MSSSQSQLANSSPDDAIWRLRDSKRSSVADLLDTVKKTSKLFESRIDALRLLIQEGELPFRNEQQIDGKRLLAAALLAVVLSDVYPLSPLKDEQIETVSQACDALGLRYRDILEMTGSEQSLLRALGA